MDKGGKHRTKKNKQTCLTLTQGTSAWCDMLCLFSVWGSGLRPWWGCTGALPFSIRWLPRKNLAALCSLGVDGLNQTKCLRCSENPPPAVPRYGCASLTTSQLLNMPANLHEKIKLFWNNQNKSPPYDLKVLGLNGLNSHFEAVWTVLHFL